MKGTAQDQACPLLREELFFLLDALRDAPRAMRDRALLLIGSAGVFGPSDLIGLDPTDIEEVREGLVLHLGRSKTDQTGQGRKIGIRHGRAPLGPVAALPVYMDVLTPDDGPILRPVVVSGLDNRASFRPSDGR